YRPEREPAPYFVEHIRKTLLPKLGANMLYKGGLRIYTTLDLEIQKAAQDAVLENLDAFDERKKKKLKEEIMEEKGAESIDEVELSTSDFKPVQGALIAIDPRNGQVRAMVGGRDFTESEFNRAMQAKRQPGSTFKPFIYTAAIDNGFTPASMLEDTPRVYYNDGTNWKLLANTTSLHQLDIDFDLIRKLEELIEGRDEDDIPEEIEEKLNELTELRNTVWAPKNYYNRFRGKITLRNGIVKSINVATVDLISRIRPVTALYYARKMGVTSPLPQTLSLALGSGEMTPVEVASAYSVFANQGIKTRPYLITKIEDYSGNIIRENFPSEEQVLSPQTNYIMVNLMQQVCEYGTGWYTKRLKHPHGGKTGTTNDFSDAWFTGYVPNLTASVWVGYDDRTTLGHGQAGGVVAAPIWTKFMQEVLAHTPELDFPVPDNITFVNFDPDTGKLATESSENAVLQPFIRGTEPTDYF
ncbi:MAG: penicillin-binding transpeptidase domain-containing protein, partial [Elusimicrobiota bacterium]|nr:penicillin-binding transpeptidase domain-containing protein [Elusimicrobiota bacterium]